MAEKTSKMDFTENEIEVLVREVEARKIILFGGHRSGVTNKRKTSEWQHVVTAVNSVSATVRSVAEVRKKWCDLKMEAKSRVAWHRQSVSATGGGQGTPEPTPLDTKIASILGTASVCDIVSEREGDTDLAETTEETDTLELEAGDEEVPGTTCPGTVAAGLAVPSTSALSTSASRAHGAPGSGRVLTDTVLQTQRDTISAINEVRDELQQIRTVMSNMCDVMSEIASSIKDLVKK
ncbi:t-SNARE domain-containing protein 1-like [Epinephelus moara]|uniref:t-SNARE domain-containing protein 1-like n=1 Tax=Epinephelus moara TaxID=300413 RepID=UPI00214EC18C|nr:t-SNARE domain-containing protein 1-like [Epinephelus moara]